MEPVYLYKATLHRVIDGDTYELNVDLGFKVYARLTFRLFGWSCQELNTVEGQLAKAEATALLTGQPLIVESYKGQQTFARWLGRIWVGGVDVGAALRDKGLARG